MDETLTLQPESPVNNPEHSTNDILVAEHLAYAQLEIEYQINKDSVNLTDHKDIVSSVIDRYPDIAPYGSLLEGAVNNFLAANEEISNYWRERVKSTAASQDVVPGFWTRSADETSAKKIIKELLGFTPQGNVQVIKGSYYLGIILNESEYLELDKQEFGADSHPTDGHYKVINQLPVVILQNTGEDLITGLLHEREHAFRHIIKSEMNAQIIHTMDRKPDSVAFSIARRILKGRVRSTLQEEEIKSEILAFFTQTVFNDLLSVELEGKDIPGIGLITPIKSEDIKSAYSELVVDSNSPDEAYHVPEGGGIRRPLQAVEALVALRNLYMSSNNAWAADQIVVNLLDQFPFKSWPAVARMLEAAHENVPVEQVNIAAGDHNFHA